MSLAMTDANRGVMVLCDDDRNDGSKVSKYAKQTEEDKKVILHFIAHVQEEQGCHPNTARKELAIQDS